MRILIIIFISSILHFSLVTADQTLKSGAYTSLTKGEVRLVLNAEDYLDDELTSIIYRMKREGILLLPIYDDIINNSTNDYEINHTLNWIAKIDGDVSSTLPSVRGLLKRKNIFDYRHVIRRDGKRVRERVAVVPIQGVVKVLGKIGNENDIPIILEFLSGENELLTPQLKPSEVKSIAREAIRALAKLGNESTIPKIKKALKKRAEGLDPKFIAYDYVLIEGEKTIETIQKRVDEQKKDADEDEIEKSISPQSAEGAKAVSLGREPQNQLGQHDIKP